MYTILTLLLAIVVAVQAYVMPGSPVRGISYGNPYNNLLGFNDLTGGVAGGVANSLSGLGSSLGGLGGFGGPFSGLRGSLNGIGGPVGGFGPRNVGGVGGLLGPAGYGGAVIPPQGLGLDYGYLRG